MADLKLEVTDESGTQDTFGDAPVLPNTERKEYKVLAENGIFKNGKVYENGSVVELTENTAEAFIEAGDVEAK